MSNFAVMCVGNTWSYIVLAPFRESICIGGKKHRGVDEIGRDGALKADKNLR